MLTLEKISKAYKKERRIFYAAKDVNFSIHKKECVGLLGDSGSGKSTIGTMIAGLTKPTSGKIYFNDEPLHYPLKKPLRKEIQILFQHPEISFNPRLKIIDSLIEPYQLYSPSFSKENIIDDIQSFGLKEEHLYRYPHELSGGEQQRLALVRVLCVKPSLLILDEPTSMLDVLSQAMIINMLQDYQQKNETAYLFITHNHSLAEFFCDRILNIEKGTIIS